MKITGHKTESIYRRYAITNGDDIRRGLELVEARLAMETSTNGPILSTPEPRSILDGARKVAEGEGFEPPRASRPGGFQALSYSPAHRAS
jgi:hypothetical protein